MSTIEQLSGSKVDARERLILTQRIKVVMVRPSQSLMLKIKKQHTEIKKRSGERTNSRGNTISL